MYKTDPNHIGKHLKKRFCSFRQEYFLSHYFSSTNVSDVIVKSLIINQIILVVNTHDRSRNGRKLYCVIGK